MSQMFVMRSVNETLAQARRALSHRPMSIRIRQVTSSTEKMKMAGSGTPWSDEELRNLISILRDRNIYLQLSNNRRNRRIYDELQKALRGLGFDRKISQIRNKVKNLKYEYFKAKDNRDCLLKGTTPGVGGRDGASPALCRYYEELHEMLGGLANTSHATVDGYSDNEVILPDTQGTVVKIEQEDDDPSNEELDPASLVTVSLEDGLPLEAKPTTSMRTRDIRPNYSQFFADSESGDDRQSEPLCHENLDPSPRRKRKRTSPVDKIIQQQEQLLQKLLKAEERRNAFMLQKVLDAESRMLEKQLAHEKAMMDRLLDFFSGNSRGTSSQCSDGSQSSSVSISASSNESETFTAEPIASNCEVSILRSELTKREKSPSL